MINTKQVKGRRQLKFKSLDEVLADAENLARLEQAGQLQQLGNWTLGQALGHLAHWIDMPYEGYPKELNPPWPIKVVVKLMKNKFLRDGLPAGVRIRQFKEGTVGVTPFPTAEGLDRLRRSAARLKAAPPPIDHILFGPISHNEWIELQLAHANLHLSFFVPRN